MNVGIYCRTETKVRKTRQNKDVQDSVFSGPEAKVRKSVTKSLFSLAYDLAYAAYAPVRGE